MIYVFNNLCCFFRKSLQVTPFILHNVPASDAGRFKELLVELKKYYFFIDPSQIGDIKTGSFVFNGRRLLLTFDDGFFLSQEIIRVLDELNIKAIFFVSTNFLDSKTKKEYVNFAEKNILMKLSGKHKDARPMTWGELNSLLDKGHLVGAHTCSHARLSLIDENSLCQELNKSADEIEKNTGVLTRHFAFPFGDISSVNATVLKYASMRYEFVYSGIRGKNDLSKKSLTIRRESISLEDSVEYNLFVLSGWLSFFYFRKRKRLDSMMESFGRSADV